MLQTLLRKNKKILQIFQISEEGWGSLTLRVFTYLVASFQFCFFETNITIILLFELENEGKGRPFRVH